jgi:putative Mg2+ transporter-C (MgtC) family protein
MIETWDQFLQFAPAFMGKLLVATLCGGAIGMERERLGKPAGLRTNILICVGSMLYTQVGISFLSTVSVPGMDPARIAAQIVTGIGFLGAGTILVSRGQVTGLTSAALIWTVGAIGIVIGVGFILIALGVTLFLVITLLSLARIEHRMLGQCHYATLRATFRDDASTRQAIVDILAANDIKISAYTLRREDGILVVTCNYCDRHATHNRFVIQLQNIDAFLGSDSHDVPHY